MKLENMELLVFDSSAIITFLKNEDGTEIVKDFLQKSAKNLIQTYINDINVGEIYYILSKFRNEDYAKLCIDNLRIFNLNFVSNDINLVIEAARFKSKGGIAYQDGFVLATAQKFPNCKIITRDSEFQRFKKEFDFIWL